MILVSAVAGKNLKNAVANAEHFIFKQRVLHNPCSLGVS